MVRTDYVPDRGDIIWLEFAPQSGHEQAGNRQAIVISPLLYNQISGLCILFPITSKIKGYPFEVQIVTELVKGVILADQVKNLHWKSRNGQFICKANNEVINEVVNLFTTLII